MLAWTSSMRSSCLIRFAPTRDLRISSGASGCRHKMSRGRHHRCAFGGTMARRKVSIFSQLKQSPWEAQAFEQGKAVDLCVAEIPQSPQHIAPRQRREIHSVKACQATRTLLIRALLFFTLVSVTPSLFAQATVGTGSIVGTVTDPSGAVISGAEVAITNIATRQVVNVATNSSGLFNSGALIPAGYRVQVGATGFSTAELLVTVLVGNTSTVNVKLQIGGEKKIVDVHDSDLRVNTEQPTVQGVLNGDQIQHLPVNGRNFLDLAQL